jgi:hypothetical protein
MAGETIKVKHSVHYKAMTESDNKFYSAGGKAPARVLFCEFFDNSIEALRRARGEAASRCAETKRVPR